MDQRTLARTGVHVTPLCLGAMMFGAWGETDHDACVRIHVTTGIRADRFFFDMSRLVDLLTALRVTEIAGLPAAITAKQQAALVRGVKLAKADAYFGKDDHVLRKAHLDGAVVIAKKDRATVGGMTRAKAVADFNMTGAGEPQNIEAPSELGSDADLQITLDALAESIQKARGTK